MIKECLLVCSAEDPRRYSGYSNSIHGHRHHHSGSSQNKNNFLTTYHISENVLGTLFLLFNRTNMNKTL